MYQENEPFLNKEHHGSQVDLEFDPHTAPRQRQSRYQYAEHSFMDRRVVWISLSLNAILSVVCLSLTFSLYKHMSWLSLQNVQSQINTLKEIDSQVWSPAQQAIEYQMQGMWDLVTDLRGEPGSNYTELWSSLLAGTLLNVTSEELVQAGEITSVKYQTGGYAAGLGVGHDLHCLKRIKDFIWLEHLHPTFTHGTPGWIEAREHADHCFDTIRQQILCRPDTSLYHLQYVDHSKLSGKPAPARLSPRQCVKFDKLQEWMQSRSGDSSQFVKPDWLVKFQASGQDVR